MTTLHDRVALITGASRGIGAAVARRFAKAGAHVVLSGRDEQRLEALRQELGAKRMTAVRCDLSEDGAPEKLIASAIEAAGTLDLLINNAAVYVPAELSSCDTASLDEHWQLNVRAPFLLAQHAHSALSRSDSAVVVNILSTLARRPVAGVAAYAASKAALRSLTQSMALEWAKDSIRVVGVSPGVVATDLHAAEHLERMAAAHPLGRVGQPEEVAAAVYFLASDESAWTTGSILEVDGGIHLA